MREEAKDLEAELHRVQGQNEQLEQALQRAEERLRVLQGE
jgi:hypothetical protein